MGQPFFLPRIIQLPPTRMTFVTAPSVTCHLTALLLHWNIMVANAVKAGDA